MKEQNVPLFCPDGLKWQTFTCEGRRVIEGQRQGTSKGELLKRTGSVGEPMGELLDAFTPECTESIAAICHAGHCGRSCIQLIAAAQENVKRLDKKYKE